MATVRRSNGLTPVTGPSEDRSGAYLAEARVKNPGTGIVIMLSDPEEPTEDAPLTAVRLVKPFDRTELERAIKQAQTAG